MRASSARAIISVIMTSAGIILVAYGPEAFRRVGHLVVAYGGYALLGAAAVVVFIRIVPRNARMLPIILIVGGLALIGLQQRSAWYAHRWALGGALLVLTGVGLATLPARPERQRDESKWPTPYRRETCVVISREVKISGKYETPTVLLLTALAGTLEADLAEAKVPTGSYGMEIFVRCAIGGRVKLRLPADWAVAAGRLGSAYGISWDDKFEFDSGELFVDPYAVEPGERLAALAEDRRKAIPDSKMRAEGFWVVVHVAGLGGSVRISRKL